MSAEYLTQKKLDHVTELIDALSEVSHRTEYNEAQAAYDDLSKNQQKALGKSYLEKLESINNIVTQNEQLLDKTTRQIDKLKSGSSRTTYEKAQAAFDELPEHLKGQIDKEYIQKLNDTAEAIRERENSADSSITTNVSDNYKTPEQLEKAGYVLNTSSHKIHKTSCSDVKRIKAQNYSTTPDYNYAVSKRYSPCGRCKP